MESLCPTRATFALLDRYRAADADTIRRGREWYRAARRAVNEIARETGYSRAQVAAVLAITSPDAQLVSNIDWTRKACLNGGRTAGRYPSDQLPKIRAALVSNRPGQYVKGPKVNAFYRAIMGHEDVLVVDRWASFAAGGPKDRPPAAKARRVITEAYHRAAEIAGETVRDFQAIVWIQARENTARADGRFVRLQDITA